MDILIAEDDENSRLMLSAALEARGHVVTAAADGRVALELAMKQPPDLIVSDILMPELDGYGLCRAVRAHPQLASTPFAFYTATFTDRRDEELAYRLGADIFLVKPCEIGTLVAELEGLAARRSVRPPSGNADALYAERLRDKLDKKISELEAERTRLRDFAEAAADWFWETDDQRIIVHTSDGAWPLRGLTLDALFALRRPGPQLHEDMEALTREFRSFRDIVIDWRQQDGGVRIMALSGRPWRDAGGHVAGYRGSARDVSRQVRAEEELRALNHELDERVRSRTSSLKAAFEELESFSYSVSHDLRGPLRAIHGFASVLESELTRPEVSGLSPAAFDALARILRAALRMEHLVDDLLELSRVTRLPLQRQPVDLSSLAQDIADSLHAGDPRRQCEVRIQPGIRVAGDVGLLRIALDNLLRNAWKFSSPVPQAVIEVGSEGRGQQAVVYVRDNGVGFDMAHADKLFNPFIRLHREGEFEGTGIGLALVQRVIRRHNGRVWARAEPGKGATFCFTLGETDAERPSIAA
ncbi:ATP-binding protein [Methyloversatilis sp.]|uniref:sensor histidine kinase n=1 Tax=Methyloversatilis sp. TaxID=2569862 RepID=UPI0035B401C2